MFAVNDYVIYGDSGVCKVEAICTPKISGIDQDALYYMISTVGLNSTTIYVKVDNIKVSVRKILTRDEAEKLIDSMPSVESIWTNDEKARERLFTQAVRSSDCRDWVKIIKTIHLVNVERIDKGRLKGRIGEVYARDAKEKLFGELSLSLGIPRQDVEEYILKRVNELESAQVS